jgi:hypothetical protein
MKCIRNLAYLSSLSSLGFFSIASAVVAQEKPTKPQSATATAQIDLDDVKEDKKESEVKWIPLLAKDSLEGWESTNFGGEGSVEIKDGVLMLGRGDPLTGVTSKKKDLPTDKYEMRWKAKRVDGTDFFAGVTFPIGKEHCSFICGGWGGGLVGISSINGNDASENETSSFRDFKNNKWYSFHVRVESKALKVWIDEEEVVSLDREGKSFSLRAEVLSSRPLGYCAFQSVTEVKDWEYRVLE